MLVGAYGAGKTSTKRSLFNEPHQIKHLSTDGADIYSIDITEWIIKERTTEYKGDKSIKEIQKLLGDTLVRGMEKMPSSTSGQQASKAEVADVLDAVKMEGEKISDVYQRLKKDNIQNTLRLSAYASDSTKTMRDDSDSDVFFSLWDFAGQAVYYITHQVFLASRVIYILVTDLTKSLVDILPVDNCNSWTVSQFLSFWMSSIHTHASPGSEVNLKQLDGSDKTVTAPPVIILGTKKDLLPQAISKGASKLNVDDEAKKRLLEIERHLRKHSPRAVNAHIVDKIAIDNKSRKREDGSIADPEVETLRQKIQQLAMEYFFRGEVSAKWIRFELSLRQQQRQKMSLDEVKTLGRQLKMEEPEIKAALAFFHSVGEILFYESIPELKHTVILDVSWLVNLFKILITKDVSSKERFGYPPKIQSLFEELHHKGRLHEELVDYLLKFHRREEDKAILLKIMELYDIMCKTPVNPGEKFMYYLPSLLQKDAEGEDSVIFPVELSSCYQLYYHFKGNFLPEGLFYRLVIRCVRHWSTQGNAVVMRKVKTRIFIERHQLHVTICKEDSDIQLQVLIPSRAKHSIQLKLKDLRGIRLVVENELDNLISTYTPGLNYQASVKCKCRSHVVGELLPGAEDVDDRCIPISEKKTTVLCPLSALPSHGPDLDIWSVTEAARTDKSDKGRGREGIDPLSDLFYTLQEDLTDDDTRHMINLLTSKQICLRDANKLKTPFDVFNDLRQKVYISENDLELLKNVFLRMRKAILVRRIDEFMQRERHC
ncbi:malignant fibrous histiocytoma-amplified sequence 1 homolog isoform X2 [Ptychodera flava]|uniref:malignant fibrous histiocytoma-amplified sequence 1 homolog isoform X2 n=1 Tax=Ptychodera flava TaxID=63121 RepID=UPI00396A0804